MHAVTFDAKVRIPFPDVKNPDSQSVYIFNMYRAASTATTAVIRALADCTDLVQFNVADVLNEVGVALVDHSDFTRPSLFVAEEAGNLAQLGQFGGYIYSGFREIPVGYARQFIFHAASVLVVRDLRDIAISQYKIVKRHRISGAAGGNIKKLREITEQQTLDEFMVSADTIRFLKRLANCYRPVIRKGTKVLRFENYISDGAFDTGRYALDLANAMSAYIKLNTSEAEYVRRVKEQISDDRSLKGHSTGGKIGLHRQLRPETQEKLARVLNPELALLGYI